MLHFSGLALISSCSLVEVPELPASFCGGFLEGNSRLQFDAFTAGRSLVAAAGWAFSFCRRVGSFDWRFDAMLYGSDLGTFSNGGGFSQISPRNARESLV